MAITDGALPIVLPAVYLLRGEDIFVAAGATGILGRRLPDSVVSLCVHDLDDDLGGGWSVTVTGRAESVDMTTNSTARDAFRRWGHENSEQIVVRVSTERISGRQLVR